MSRGACLGCDVEAFRGDCLSKAERGVSLRVWDLPITWEHLGKPCS